MESALPYDTDSKAVGIWIRLSTEVQVKGAKVRSITKGGRVTTQSQKSGEFSRSITSKASAREFTIRIHIGVQDCVRSEVP